MLIQANIILLILTIYNLFYILPIGHPKSLSEFTYQDSDINDVILSCMSNLSFLGVSGSISFGEGADPIKNVKMGRIQGILPYYMIRLWCRYI